MDGSKGEQTENSKNFAAQKPADGSTDGSGFEVYPKKRPTKVLSAAFVRGVKVPGMYSDGDTLYLVVDPSGAKRWIQRLTIGGRQHDLGLGGLSTVSLAEAREKALHNRKLARDGGDPLAAKREKKAAAFRESSMPTFETAARQVHAEHSKSFKNPVHSKQWIQTLETYAFPTMGAKRVDTIASADVMAVLSPIWLSKAETARRVRQRMKVVFDWSKAKGFRSGDNPTEGISKVLPKHNQNKKHFDSLPYARVPEFVGDIRQYDGVAARLAFELLILCAARTGEVIYAEKSEFDLKAGLWTVPAARMKMKQEHIVPLAPRSIEIVEQALAITDGSKFLFPGARAGHPFSNAIFHSILAGEAFVKFGDLTPHGFRSSFRVWAEEKTHAKRSVIEKSLAHAVKDSVEAAYLRTPMLEQRLELMQLWADFVVSTRTGQVLQFHA